MKEIVIKERKKVVPEKRKFQSISLPRSLYERIDDISKETNVPKTEIAVKMLEFALENTKVV